jgi:excisionase family DNA binding protein
MTLLTVKEACALLKISERKFRRMVLAGMLPAFKVGEAWRITDSELERWVMAQPRPANRRRKAVGE